MKNRGQVGRAKMQVNNVARSIGQLKNYYDSVGRQYGHSWEEYTQKIKGSKLAIKKG